MFIKLRLSLDISLSKVILSAAGITATVCAFQYFDSKKKKPGSFFKTENKFSDYEKMQKKLREIRNLRSKNVIQIQ